MLILADTVLLLVVAALLGRGVHALAGRREWEWTAPAVGLAALMPLVQAASQLPGGLTTAAILVALSAAAVAAHELRSRDRPRAVGGPQALAAAALVLAAMCIPFAVHGRIELPGMSANDDPARHLLAIAFIASGADSPGWVLGGGYPQGPHEVVALLGAITGARDDQALAALVLAVPMLTALAAFAAWEQARGSMRGWRPVIGAALAGLPYLLAAWYAQSAFKEALLALFVLAFALELRGLTRRPRLDRRSGVPLAVLAGGCLATYSFFGLAWPAAILGVWALAHVVTASPPRRSVLTAGLRRVRVAAAPALAVLGLVVLTNLGPVLELFSWVGLSPAGSGAITEGNRGYIIEALSPLEALGVWPSGDYRLAPRRTVLVVLAGLLSLTAVAYGLAWWIRRRDLAIPAAVAAGFVAYLVLLPGQSPYVSAKALVIVSPLVAVLCVRALLDPGHPLPRVPPIARMALATAFVAAAAGSSLLSLRTAQVATTGHRQQLEALGEVIGGEPVLHLAFDQYAGWRLFGHQVTTPGGAVPLRPEKRFVEGDPMDFDSVFPESLDAFEHVITSRAAFASAAPKNFRPVRRTAHYVLWRRTGPTPSRTILAEGSAPGAPMDCATPPPRRQRAAVMPVPVAVVAPETISAGDRATLTLALAPGRWDLSLQYRAPRPLEIEGPGLRASLDETLDQLGPFWPAGTIVVPGGTEEPLRAVNISLSLPAEPLPGLRRRVALLGRLAATRAGVRPRMEPGRRACGDYVDWISPVG